MTDALPAPSAAPMPVSRGLGRLCALVRLMAVLGSFVVVWLPVWFWTHPDQIHQWWRSSCAVDDIVMTIDDQAVILGAFVMLLPVGITLFTLRKLWRLFGEYGRGRAFSRAAQGHLHGVAIGFTASALVSPLFRTLMTLVLTMGNPAGQRVLALSFQGGDYLLMLISVVLLAIATVMAEAVKRVEEHAEFV